MDAIARPLCKFGFYVPTVNGLLLTINSKLSKLWVTPRQPACLAQDLFYPLELQDFTAKGWLTTTCGKPSGHGPAE